MPSDLKSPLISPFIYVVFETVGQHKEAEEQEEAEVG